MAKQVARAVRGHLFLLASLNTILVANSFNLPVPGREEDESTNREDLEDEGQTEDCSGQGFGGSQRSSAASNE